MKSQPAPAWMSRCSRRFGSRAGWRLEKAADESRCLLALQVGTLRIEVHVVLVEVGMMRHQCVLVIESDF